MKYQDLSIKKKLYLGFGVAVLLVAVISFFAFSQFTTYREIARDNVLMGRLQANLLYCRLHAKDFIQTGSESSVTKFNERMTELESLIATAQNDINNPERAAKVDTIDTDMQTYKADFAKVVDLMRQRDHQVANVADIQGPIMSEKVTEIMQSATRSGNTRTVLNGGNARYNLTLARLNFYKYLMQNKPEQLIEAKKGLNETVTAAIDNIAGYRGLVAEFNEAKALYSEALNQTGEIIDERNDIIQNSLDVIGPKIADTAEWIKLDIIKEQDTIGPRVQILLTWIPILGSILLIIFAFINIRSIVNPIVRCTDAADKLADGDFNVDLTTNNTDETGRLLKAMETMVGNISNVIEEIGKTAVGTANGNLDIRGDSSKFSGEYQNIINNFNDALNSVISPLIMMAEYVDRISKGDLPSYITEDYKGDFMEVKNNLNLCIDSISALIEDSRMLSEAAVAGKLDVRADEMKHDGDYQKIIKGVNSTLDALINPINVANENMISISKGIIPPKITEDYNGDFNNLKNSINLLIDNLNNFIGQVQYMAEEQAAGDIDVFIDESRFDGAYKEMAQKVNFSVKDQIEGTMKILDTIKAYSENNFDHVLDKQPGKRAIANEYLDRLRSDFVNMIDEINGIITSISEGNLSYRGKAENHTGTYHEIIAGFNETLDALITPINITSDYTEKLSRGILPPRITDTYSGDFNISKDSINKLIETFETFINEMNSMAEDHDSGEIETRMNVDNYEGAYEEMAVGLNRMVEGHINPILETISIMNDYGNGDFSKEMYDLPGKKIVLTEGVNNIRKNLIAFSEELNILIEAAKEGVLDKRGDDEQFTGGWQELVAGVNSILDAVVEPIDEAGEVLEEMSQGDLTVRMRGAYRGQLAKLKDDINALATSLSTALSKVNAAVIDTAEGASNINSASETIAAASQEMNSQADDVASAVEEMARTVTENARGATDTAEMASESSDVATEGGQVVQDTVRKMNDIAKVVEDTARSIEKLGESSKAIGDIVSVIDDIADQTNLLALNASIEAARAGEQGRGFAVVADEVRKLAEKTVDATKEIAEQITSIQKQTFDAVEAMDQGTKEVENGIRLADRAGQALEKVLSSSNHVSQMIADIAAASEQQAATTEEISKNVLGISQATAESTQQIQDVADISEQLAGVTGELNNLMSEFKISSEGNENLSLNPGPSGVLPE